MTSEPHLGPVALPDSRARHTVEKLLDGSGVTLNGSSPQDIQVYHPISSRASFARAPWAWERHTWMAGGSASASTRWHT